MNHGLTMSKIIRILLLLFTACGCTTVHGESLSLSLVDAVEQRDWKKAEAVLASTPDTRSVVMHSQGDGMTPLHWSVKHGNANWTERLLTAGADANAKTFYGVTPLSIACQLGDVSTTERLLQNGADPNQFVAGKTTPVMLAARAGNPALVAILIEHHANVDAVQRAGQSALMFAAAEGHTAVVAELLDAGADLNRALSSGFTALGFAARQGRIETAMLLLDRGASLSEPMKPKQTSGRNPRNGMTPLMLAVESAHYELAMKFIDRGADPNEQVSEFAPLHALTWVRRPQKGDNPEGDPPPRGSGDLSALQFVRAIVEAGADVNLPLRRGKAGQGRLSPRGATPFLMACQTVDLPYLQLLLELGADPMIANADGCTALMAAAGVGNHHVGEHEGTPEEVEQAVRMLVDLGLDINAVANNGETAMHGAAYRCFPETVRLVATLGAREPVWNHKNKFGWSPLDIAKGYRPGSFKPDPATIAAIEELMAGSPAGGPSPRDGR